VADSWERIDGDYIPDDYDFDTWMRLGDNDDDPGGYPEYAVAYTTGGQFAWGTTTGQDVYCPGVGFIVDLSQSRADVRMRVDVRNLLVDDEVEWGDIANIVLRVEVQSGNQNLGIQIDNIKLDNTALPNNPLLGAGWAFGANQYSDAIRILLDPARATFDITGTIKLKAPAGFGRNDAKAQLFFCQGDYSMMRAAGASEGKSRGLLTRIAEAVPRGLTTHGAGPHGYPRKPA
jgi:hypothetical protein